MALGPANPKTGLPDSISKEKQQLLGQALYVLVSRATDDELDEYKSWMSLVKSVIGYKPKPAPVKLSEAMKENAGGYIPPAPIRNGSSTAAQQLRDEEVIRAARAKYGDDWNDPQMRAMHDEADRMFGF